MICANKTLSTFPNGQKLDVLDNFPYLETILSRGANGKHVRAGLAKPRLLIVGSRAKAAVVADISECGVFEQRPTSLYYECSG